MTKWMYSRCISCRRRLGKNEELEQMPVGRTIAFDTESARLWIVCRRCRNWNLVPLEERWEAIEEAEQRLIGARTEASSGNIELRRLADGSALIRIARVTAPEFAVWRYASRISGRYRRSLVAGATTASGIAALSALSPLGFVPLALTATVGWAAALSIKDLMPVMRTDDGLDIRAGDGARMLLHPADNVSGWCLIIPRFRRQINLEQQDAVRALRRLLPRTNMYGGKPNEVAEAAIRVRSAEANDQFIRSTAVSLGHKRNMDPSHHPLVIGALGRARPHRIATADPAIRLALEIAVNEMCEWRLLEGDLVELHREWREAEELAAISDNLALPERMREWIR